MRLVPARQRERYDSVCDPSLDYDRELPNEEEIYTLVLGRTVDGERDTLRLIPDGAEAIDYFRADP